MAQWYWRVVALKAAFLLTFAVSYLRADDVIQKLPFCDPSPNVESTGIHDLVIVSTLDGKLTAFSTSLGTKAWDIQTEPLLSSNLHHIELTSEGKWVRLVPSLSGSLYRLSAEALEPLPLAAEHLLSSSFKYSDDLVIAGSKQTDWIGLDAGSGRVIYKCGSKGCTNDEETANAGRDVLVLRQNSNIIRALDPRSGHEKWNFSVAEHQIALSVECGHPKEVNDSDLSVMVVLPDGVVGVKTNKTPQSLLWQHQLQAPVAGLWRLRSGVLEALDVLVCAGNSLVSPGDTRPPTPSLYIGLHDQQLYVQESISFFELAEKTSAVVPWKPTPARPMLTTPGTALATLSDKDRGALALHTLYSKNAKTNYGYFLFGDKSTCEKGAVADEGLVWDRDDNSWSEGERGRVSTVADHHHVHVHVSSLWYWWKEVVVIAVSSALLMNLMIWPRFFAPKLRPMTPPNLSQEVIIVERHYERPAPAAGAPGPEYSSRYECDFTPLRCLGRGGFGVVFEARNNIDHCSYAVKRITLPRREHKRERVLREVRALAKLEHENIVRYFNAWLEEPPPHWQEQRDNAWIRELDGVSLAMTEDYTSPKPPYESQSILTSMSGEQARRCSKDTVTLDLQKSLDVAVDALNYEKQLGDLPKRLRSRSCNDSFSIVFDENASTKEVTDATKETTEDPDSSSKHSPKHSLTNNASVPKHSNLAGDDDSFIVFANSSDLNHNSKGLADTRSVNKQLEKVKDASRFANGKHNKKSHRRHWSLDLCVKDSSAGANLGRDRKMFLYIQMQLCLRDSLHDWLRHNRSYETRREKAVVLFSQIVSAVEYVHLAGLIHRDLKPSNIFFAPDGRVKVGDFGLVTAMGDSSDGGDYGPQHIDLQARHTYRVGTHLYMSPEQLAGKPYSYKVDIYSLGLVLFELLQPFSTEAERVTCLLRLRDQHFPRQFAAKYPQEMEVLKLMLSEDANFRPTASGVKARAPLHQVTDELWHFNLPNATPHLHSPRRA